MSQPVELAGPFKRTGDASVSPARAPAPPRCREPGARTSEVRLSAAAPAGLMTRSKCTSSPSGVSNTSFTEPLRGLRGGGGEQGMQVCRQQLPRGCAARHAFKPPSPPSCPAAVAQQHRQSGTLCQVMSAHAANHMAAQHSPVLCRLPGCVGVEQLLERAAELRGRKPGRRVFFCPRQCTCMLQKDGCVRPGAAGIPRAGLPSARRRR